VPITNCITTGTPPVTTCGAPIDQRFYIVFTPKNAVSASIDYEHAVFGGAANLRFHFDGNYADATQAFDQFATKADSSLIFNGRVSLADIRVGDTQDLSISIWGRNLFDEEHVFRRDPSNSLPAAPTTSLTTGSIGNVMGDYGNFNARAPSASSHRQLLKTRSRKAENDDGRCDLAPAVFVCAASRREKGQALSMAAAI
jgi:hypothetical protein